ncbi:MAG: hypothetical protein R6U96_03815 [Promethearchaeia archaeon]
MFDELMDCIEDIQKNLSKMTRKLMEIESKMKKNSPEEHSPKERQKPRIKSQDQLSKFKMLLGRVKRIFAFNENKAILREDLVEVLELEEFTDKRFIQMALDQLIQEGILYEPRKNYLKFIMENKEYRHRHKILDVRNFKLFPDRSEKSNKDGDGKN